MILLVTVPIVFFAEPIWFAAFIAACGAMLLLVVVKLVASALKLLIVGGLF